MHAPRFILPNIVSTASTHAMMKLIRQAGRWAYGCYVWLAFALILLSFGSLIVLVRSPRYSRSIARRGARLLFHITAVPFSAHGIERLPRTPHILLLNHTSFLDGLALAAVLPARPGYAFVVRQQYRRQRLLCPLFHALGGVVLHQAAAAHAPANVDLLAAALRRGDNLIVFPEGGFVPEAGLRPFHSGAFVAAVAENVPIVVAGLRGARQALRPRSWLPRRTRIEVEIGVTLTPDNKGDNQGQKLCETAYKAMLPLVGEDASRP